LPQNLKIIDPLPLALMELRRRLRSGATKVDDKVISFLVNTPIVYLIFNSLVVLL